MTDGEPKISYEPTIKRRFELSHDEFSRERVRALLKAHRQLKEEVPFYAGMTLFGSLSKGKELTEDTALFSDIDLVGFIDKEKYDETIRDFKVNNQDFSEYVEWVIKHKPKVTSLDMDSVRDQNVKRAAELFIAKKVKDILSASIPEDRLNPNAVRMEVEDISYGRDEKNKASIFDVVAIYNKKREWMLDLGLFGKEEVEKVVKLDVAMPFFYDIGGGLAPYRKEFMKRMLDLPVEEREKHWTNAVNAMKYWERKNDIPPELQSTYPDSFSAAIEYYKPKKSQGFETETTKPFSIVEINNSTINDLLKLKEAIANNNGTTNVMVHPWYVSDASEDLWPTPVSYSTARTEFIKTAVEQGMPLIVFEEASGFGSLKQRVAATRGTLYVVSTTHDNPLPVSVEDYQNRRFRQNEITRWEPLIRLFKELGVRHAIVGGKYMNIDRPVISEEKTNLAHFQSNIDQFPNAREFLEKGVLPSGCPGAVVQKLLESGIDVSISPISHPENKIK